MKRREYLCLTGGLLGASATTGCLSPLGGAAEGTNTYLEPPDNVPDVDHPTYGEAVPETEITDVFTGEEVSTDQDTEFLMTFFYSFCPTECIWTISSLTHTEARVVEGGGATPRILAVTFDPARDSPEKLHDYAERMGVETESGWSFLRPEDEKAAERIVSGKFGVSFSKRSTGGIYDFLHDTLILLVNKDGYVERTYTNEDPDPEVMASDLTELREAQDA
jgi:protein SCO1/2